MDNVIKNVRKLQNTKFFPPFRQTVFGLLYKIPKTSIDLIDFT